MEMLMNHFHTGLFGAKSFLIADSIFHVFSSKSINAFVERDKTKFARSFFPDFLCSSAIAKSSVLLLIFFLTINSDASKLDNLLEVFCFSCFVHFVVHCFVYYLRFLFLLWIFTIDIYAFFCLKATYFLQIWMTLTTHRNLNTKNLLRKVLSRSLV